MFGRPFASTPDLPFRVGEGIESSGFDMRPFFCAQEGEGYLDQAFSKESEARVRRVTLV